MLPLHIGNDIVDLKDKHIQGKWQSNRFLMKICCNDEIKFVRSASDPHLALWIFWAIKEASFKALKKRGSLPFIPSRYVVKSLNSIWSCQYKDLCCEVEVICTEDYVHAVALNGKGVDFNLVLHRILQEEDEKKHSAAVRKLALELLDESGVNGCDIVRMMGDQAQELPPMVIRAGQQVKECDVSLSHDGRFVAAAIVKPMIRVANTD